MYEKETILISQYITSPSVQQQHVQKKRNKKRQEEHDIMENVGYLQCVWSDRRERAMNRRRISLRTGKQKSPPLKQIKKLSSKQKKKDVLMAWNSVFLFIFFAVAEQRRMRSSCWIHHQKNLHFIDRTRGLKKGTVSRVERNEKFFELSKWFY